MTAPPVLSTALAAVALALTVTWAHPASGREPDIRDNERLLFAITRENVDIWGTGRGVTLVFERTSRSFGELYLEDPEDPTARQFLGSHFAPDFHRVLVAIDRGDLGPLRDLIGAGTVPPDVQPRPLDGMSEALQDYLAQDAPGQTADPDGTSEGGLPGWSGFDADMGMIVWMPAETDTRDWLPIVWTCLDSAVEASFPRPEGRDPPRQLVLQINGQSFSAQPQAHDHGLAVEHPHDSGIVTALGVGAELIVIADGAEVVRIALQSGDTEAFDRWRSLCATMSRTKEGPAVVR